MRLLWLMLALALALGAAGALGPFGDKAVASLLFGAWCAVLLGLFAAALHLPLAGVRPRLRAWLATPTVVAAAVAVTVGANIALYRHDAHFDLSREEQNTPPPEFADVIGHLRADLSLTYFYNNGDDNAVHAAELLAIAARGNPRFHVRAVDLDKEPGLAHDLGVRSYNTAVLEADQRRVVSENTTDLTGIAYAALRALKERTDTVCFVSGHGEGIGAAPTHIHYSHVETLRGHDAPGAGDVLMGEPEGLDRFALALTEIGYDIRAIAPSTLAALPPDCTAVAEIGPRAAYGAGEAKLIADYLAGGGRLLLLLDPDSPVAPELDRMLAHVGLHADSGVVIDPLNHFRTDEDKVAVPYYPPHPITERIAMTIFADARPIRVDRPPEGVAVSVLAASSKDSFRRAPPIAAAAAPAAAAADNAEGAPGAQILAVAAEGRWPAAAGGKRFRLVLAGTSKFAANEYFPYVSNGELAVAMVRWLAQDEAMTAVKPRSYALPEATLTRLEMRNIFILIELVLPAATLALGALVWWRRR